jgi:hypothetical protein
VWWEVGEIEVEKESERERAREISLFFSSIL